MIALRGELAGADRLLNEGLRGDPFRGFLTLAVGPAGEAGDNVVSCMDSLDSQGALA
jgi:hypothetical protein